MKLTQKKLSEENQLEKSDPKRLAKPVRLTKQEIILQHKLNKSQLKSDAEKFAYEAGRAAAEISLATNCDASPAGKNKAEDVLEAIYESIEAGDIYISTANRILNELEKPVRQRIGQLRKKLLRKPSRKRRC
jgi:hypothetical protein